MIELAPATEADLIAAFLVAEINASREWGPMIRNFLQAQGIPRRIIDVPDTNNQAESNFRREMLAQYRGCPDRLLFTGFPVGVTWRRVRLEPEDFQRMRPCLLLLPQSVMGRAVGSPGE